MAVPWAEVRRGAELEERRGLVPVVAVAVAWVFEPGSSPFINTTNRPIYPVRCPGVEGMAAFWCMGAATTAYAEKWSGKAATEGPISTSRRRRTVWRWRFAARWPIAMPVAGAVHGINT